MFIEFALVAGIVSSFFTPATTLAIEESALVAPKNVSKWEISQDRTLPWTIEELLRYEGLSGKELEMALETIKYESGNDPLALGDKGKSRGLWQFHKDFHKISDACAFNPSCSTEYALKIWHKGHQTRCKIWSVYRNLYC